jgi:hypothetical protein
MAIMVYKYDMHSKVRLPEEALAQLRLAHQMRNALVEAELAQEQRVNDLYSQQQQVAVIESELAAVDEMIVGLIKQARAEHSEDRTTATRKDTAKALADARKQAKVLRAARKEAKAEQRLVLKPQLEALKQGHKETIVSIRQDFAARGLHWGSYNAVIDNHRVSVNRIKTIRKEGRPAQIRFHRWKGNGTLTVQLQREAGDPRRSPEILASGEGKWRNVLRVNSAAGDPAQWAALTDAQRKNGGLDRGILTWSLGGGVLFTLPTTIHRPLPPHADVCRAQLTVRQVAGHQEISVAVTVDVPDPEPVQGRTLAAMHFGWRRRDDESVRTAVWASLAPLDVPRSVADVVRSYDGGRWGEIVLPADWLDRAAYPAVLRSKRDLALEPVARKLAAWLDEHPQDDLTGGTVRQWRAADRFARLALAWRDEPPEGADEIAELLNAWRKQDRHLWEWEFHQRLKVVRRRDDAWGRVGAWLADRTGMILLDDTQFAKLRRRPDVSETDPVLPGAPAQAARARAVLAAPGRLRELVSKGAARRGVTIKTVPAEFLTRTHKGCGHVADADPRYATAMMVVCPSCGQAYDQDHNAALLMLERERCGPAPDAQESSQV